MIVGLDFIDEIYKKGKILFFCLILELFFKFVYDLCILVMIDISIMFEGNLIMLNEM